jgi:hypothetical protein
VGNHNPAMVSPPPVTPRWHDGRTVIVAAPGPSLTQEVADRCRGFTILAVKEAYRLFPWAEVLYGCDGKFWDRRDGCRDFTGERWSSHGERGVDDKTSAAAKYDLHLVRGKAGSTFSLDPKFIHYGSNSGFQAINLTILFGATSIVLVGFDMREVDGNPYFFGKHPARNVAAPYAKFAPLFAAAAKQLPPSIRIVNATPKSALKCWPMMDLDSALPHAPRTCPA